MSVVPPDAYEHFAWVYDRALGVRFFETVRPLLEHLVRKHVKTPGAHLDLACGTGLATGFFGSRGFQSIGVDASASMLSVARGRANRLVMADMRALPLRRPFRLVTCLYDSLNHLMDTSQLTAAFRSVRALMDDRSVFVFDMNHPSAYTKVWSIPEPFEASGPDFHLSMDTSYSRLRKQAFASLSGWIEIDGARQPIREDHQQRAFTRREIVRCLRKASLQEVEVVGFDPFEDDDGSRAPTKLLFVVRTIQPAAEPS